MEFALPTIGEGVYEAELVRWLVSAGDAFRPGQTLLEVLTDKATMEVPAPMAGTVIALRAEPGAIVKIGQTLFDYEPTNSIPAAAPRPEAAEPVRHAAPTRDIPAQATKNGPALKATPLSVKASPSVRLLARKMGLDLTRIAGSGPDGRILADDLTRASLPALESKSPVQRPRETPMEFGRPGQRIPLVGLRRKIAEHMVHSRRTIPDYSYVDEADVTELVRLRESLKEPFASAGVRLTYLAFFVKAVVAALREVPLVNASLDEERNEIVVHDRYHLGIAVATPAGLIVPVLRDADQKDLATLAREIERLSTEARAGRSRLEEVRGSTFTITSVGNVGGLISTPVINHPEVGILGIGKIVKRPVYDSAGQIRPADLMYLSFAFDHRVVDGAVGAAFGNAVLRAIQHPARLLLPDRL
ncbi:MAG: dihydrolipoamide acetyltransferase family protein [Gemmataceae bacterium]